MPVKPDRILIAEVLSLPTAPFHEEKVARYIFDFCRRHRFPCAQDSFGNLKVVYKNGRASPVAFTAHMDHPGFEIVKGGNPAVGILLGGVPDRYFPGASVVVCDGDRQVKGKVAAAKSKKKRTFFIRAGEKIAQGSFGFFNLPGCRFQNGKIYSRAIDNVASVALLLNFLKELSQTGAKAHAVCLFTRAEEVGFVGASGAIRGRFLPEKIPVVVLETSSARSGGVAIGGGPVLRVGDNYSNFSFEMDVWLRNAARRLAKREKVFRYQRALMQGGRCEASVYVAAGYCTGGVALPLANYHNAGPKSYAAEYVSERDFGNLLRWLLALAVSPPPSAVFRSGHRIVEERFRRYAGRLKKIPRR